MTIGLIVWALAPPLAANIDSRTRETTFAAIVVVARDIGANVITDDLRSVLTRRNTRAVGAKCIGGTRVFARATTRIVAREIEAFAIANDLRFIRTCACALPILTNLIAFTGDAASTAVQGIGFHVDALMTTNAFRLPNAHIGARAIHAVFGIETSRLTIAAMIGIAKNIEAHMITDFAVAIAHAFSPTTIFIGRTGISTRPTMVVVGFYVDANAVTNDLGALATRTDAVDTVNALAAYRRTIAAMIRRVEDIDAHHVANHFVAIGA